MPELPEVETIRSQLAREITGKRVKSVAVDDGRLVRRHKSAKDFRALVEGRTFKGAQRLGKNLVLAMDDGNYLIVHLGMSGQLLKAKNAKEPKVKHTHVVLAFTSGEELRYVDARTFGELYVAPPLAEGEEAEVSKFARLSIGGDGLDLRRKVPALAHLGIDPFEDQVGWDRFAAVLRSRSTGLKALLTDQDIVAGIGNIYADEILFSAGLLYDRPSNSLSTIEIRRLHRAIPEILTEAVKAGGTTLSDESYVNLEGKPGSYQDQLRVHGREGEPCPVCRTPISKVVYHQRGTYYCPKCQA
jgi:formamidopyrimidine-DNA glycosylase